MSTKSGLPEPGDAAWKGVVSVAMRALNEHGYTTRLPAVDTHTRLALGAGCDPHADPNAWSLLKHYSCPSEIVLDFLEQRLQDAVCETLADLADLFDKDANGDLILLDPNVCPVTEALRSVQAKVRANTWYYRLMFQGVVITGPAVIAWDPTVAMRLRTMFRTHIGGLLHLNPEFKLLALPDPYDYCKRCDGGADGPKHPPELVAEALRKALDLPVEPELLLDGLFLLAAGCALYWLQDCSRGTAHTDAVCDDLWSVAGDLIRKDRTFAAPDKDKLAVTYLEEASTLRRMLRVEKRIREQRVASIFSGLLDRVLVGKDLVDLPLDFLYGAWPSIKTALDQPDP